MCSTYKQGESIIFLSCSIYQYAPQPESLALYSMGALDPVGALLLYPLVGALLLHSLIQWGLYI